MKKSKNYFFLKNQRWLKMIVLTIVSCSICIILYPAFTFVGNKIVALFPAQHQTIGIFIIWFIASTLCGFILIRLGGFRFLDFWSINSLRYPPAWLFALVSASLYFLITPIIWELPKAYQFSIEIFFFIIVAVITAFVISGLLNIILSPRDELFASSKIISRFKTEKKDLKSIIQNTDAFIKWLKEEKPINDPGQDLFDLSVFARRLTRIFQSSPLKTIAIIGDYGCGKSSILKMTEFFLENSQYLAGSTEDQNEKLFNLKKIIHCKVSGWGLQKGAAAEHILNSTIKKLSDYADCLELVNIPSHYRSALSNTGSIWGKAFAALTCSYEDPLKLLKEMDVVLKCIKQRMVIFLEDLDRNDFDKAYWDEITALLDRLKDLDNISFVLAINQNIKQENFLLRISEHTEYVPPLSRLSVIECLVKFREICLNITTGRDIDCLSKEERDKHLGVKKSSQEYNIAEMLSLEANAPIDAIAKLLDNPRSMKAAMRRTLQTWQTLHGEIDFDVLFAVRVIYTVAPEAFAFINRNIKQIRQLAPKESYNQYTHERDEKTRNKLASEWQQITPATLDNNALSILMQFIFPGWDSNSFHGIKMPQGLLSQETTDYWIRLNREEILEKEISDQVILHAINDWKSEHSKVIYNSLNLPQALYQLSGFADKVEQFGLFLDGQEVRTLAHELFDIMLKDDSNLKKLADYSGFIQLWRLSLDKPIDGHEQWIVSEIRKALIINLWFANDIYYYWRYNNRWSIDGKEQTPYVRNGFIEAAKEIFGNNAQALIEAIDNAHMYSIHHFMVFYSEPDGGGPGFKVEEWHWLINVLIEAGEKNPQIVIPQIVALIIDQEKLFRVNKMSYKLNSTKLKEIFSSNENRVMKLLSTEIDYSQFDEEVNEHIQFARQEAIKWLAEKK